MTRLFSLYETVSRYLHTVRYLRSEQIVGRVWYQIFRPRLLDTNLPAKRRPAMRLLEPRPRMPSMTGPNSFVFLNRGGRVSSSRDWNNPEHAKLWLYNLHYFDDLNAYDAESRWEWHQRLVERWITENPPGSGIGWEPYPVSLRVVNWIKWDLRRGGLERVAARSLALQLRWLRRRLEYHLLGNHLLANAKALICGGLYFEGPEADEWFRTGWRIFGEQLREQVLPDGGHFELSPMYHLIVLEDVLDVLNVCQAYGVDVPHDWEETVCRMLQWAAVMRHPDGQIPFFNDAAFGLAGTFDELADYADRLFGYRKPSDPGSVHLADSGYVRLAKGTAVVFLDVAHLGPDYLPGHGHADTLSLELSLFGQRVLVNSGTSVYGTGPERERQRGTGTHNTVMVDGENSSEVWGGFRVARRARPRIIECLPERGCVAAEHDGYLRLVGKPIHRRQVQLSFDHLMITDAVTTTEDFTGGREVVGAWHFHPSVNVQPLELSRGTGDLTARCRLLVPTDGGVRQVVLSIEGASNAVLQSSTWHPEFGRSVPTTRLVFSYNGSLPAIITTYLKW